MLNRPSFGNTPVFVAFSGGASHKLED